MFVCSAVISLMIGLIQCLLGLKSIQENLLKGYRGQIKYKYKNVNSAMGSTHFTGYLVGFLANGFFIVFILIFVILLAVYFVFRIYRDQFEKVLLLIMPFVVVYIIKLLIDYLLTKFVFLQKHGKYLSVENFRVFSLYVYFMFFLDCVWGFASAVLRMIQGIIVQIIFMPRISYNLIAGPLKKFDEGYTVFNGYLRMEIGKFNIQNNLLVSLLFNNV